MIKIKDSLIKYFKSFSLIGLIIMIGLIALDQITKIIVKTNMELGQSIKIINNFFYFTYTRNTGAAWSSFEDSYAFLMIITIVALIFFLYLYKDIDFKTKKIYSISICMMIAGTIGNLIDRLARILFDGLGVIDFLDFVIFGYDFPIFNVADICLVVGIFLIAFDIIFLEKKREAVVDDQGSNWF